MPAQSPLAPSEPSGTASETTPLLSSSAASPLSPEVPQLTDDAAADALDASSISLSESQIPDLPFSILVPALGSLWLVLFLAAMDGTIGKQSIPYMAHAAVAELIASRRLLRSMTSISCDTRFRHRELFPCFGKELVARIQLHVNSLRILAHLRQTVRHHRKER